MIESEQEQRKAQLAIHRSKLEYRKRLEIAMTERRLSRAMTENRSESYGIRPELRTTRLGNEVRRNRLARGYTMQPASEYSRLERERERDSALERELQLPQLGQEFNRLRLMREMRKNRARADYEHVPCGECDVHCERCQRRCCGDCQHLEGRHQVSAKAPSHSLSTAPPQRCAPTTFCLCATVLCLLRNAVTPG